MNALQYIIAGRNKAKITKSALSYFGFLNKNGEMPRLY
jgi:hypothetical protein